MVLTFGQEPPTAFHFSLFTSVASVKAYMYPCSRTSCQRKILSSSFFHHQPKKGKIFQGKKKKSLEDSISCTCSACQMLHQAPKVIKDEMNQVNQTKPGAPLFHYYALKRPWIKIAFTYSEEPKPQPHGEHSLSTKVILVMLQIKGENKRGKKEKDNKQYTNSE